MAQGAACRCGVPQCAGQHGTQLQVFDGNGGSSLSLIWPESCLLSSVFPLMDLMLCVCVGVPPAQGTWTMPDVWQQLQAITSRPPARTATSLKPLKGPQAAANSNSRRRVRRPAEQQLSCSPRLAFGTQLLEAPGPG